MKGLHLDSRNLQHESCDRGLNLASDRNDQARPLAHASWMTVGGRDSPSASGSVILLWERPLVVEPTSVVEPFSDTNKLTVSAPSLKGAAAAAAAVFSAFVRALVAGAFNGSDALLLPTRIPSLGELPSLSSSDSDPSASVSVSVLPNSWMSFLMVMKNCGWP